MAAAVADFRSATRVPGKMSRRASSSGQASRSAQPQAAAGTSPSLPLIANPDLLAEMSVARRGGRPLLIGFAAEIAADAGDLVNRATKKLTEKKCDVMIANDVGGSSTGFGHDENAVTIVYPDGAFESLARAPKTEIADSIWDRLASRIGGRTARGLATTSGLTNGAGRRDEGSRLRRTVVVRPPVLARAGSRTRGRRA
ncbi:MAG: hypothetical protein H7X95_06490 [Deltaproteobacteria bacterium]|nr:hypothetical protein [Deltaproteobacteria bacterium]